MKASAANFLSLIKGPKQFVIPIYQRTYSWQISQCSKLLSDIIRISNDPTTPGHFIGSVVYFQESIHTLSDVPQLLVIDGQQRLTTITLLMAALAEFIKDNNIEIDTSFTKLQNYYLLNVEEEGDLRYKLLLTKRDKETIINIVKGVKLPVDYSQRVWENFDYFKKQISRENAVTIYNGIQRLFVVDVALEREKDNPQLIFESLNSTGLDLSQADLIRNYVLMGQGFSIQTELYERYWYPMESNYGNEYATTFDWFMRDYLSVKTNQIPRIDRVYEGFKNYVQAGKPTQTITDVVKDIYKFSDYYVNMVLTKEPDKDLNKAFKSISKLKVDVSYPFLLPVYDDYATERITKEEFLTVINYVENYVFRRAICGIPTNSLNKTFATLYKSFNKAIYLEGIEAAFQLMDGYKRFPADAELEKEIVIKDLYNFRSRNYLLSKLENYNRKEFVNVDEYTIEHILPQNPDLSPAWKSMLGENWKHIQETYLHTLGNLTLTGYNSELSDKPFSEKKTMPGGFNHSPIRLNSFMQNVDEWNEENIKLRANELAAIAIKIWKAPCLSQETLEKYKPKEEKETSIYTIDNYEYLKGDMLDLYQVLRKRILNIDASVKEDFKKLYIAFKSSTNFVDIVPQKARLRLSLNIEFNDIIDPKGWCKDVSGLGRWGNGDVEVGVNAIGELDYIIELVQQAFDAQLETA
jgi:uncharacterized protein with ParB-like and HNH nuclease domain/predicted transport protein